MNSVSVLCFSFSSNSGSVEVSSCSVRAGGMGGALRYIRLDIYDW